MPRFQENQSKANFIKALGENVTKGYKRKKLIDLPKPHDVKPAAVESASNFIEHDMDVEDGNSMDALQPSLPAESAAPAPPPPPPESAAPAPPPPPEENETSIRSPSPSLEDLKAQQAELLQQLESNTSLNTSNLSVADTNALSVKSQTDDDEVPVTDPPSAQIAKPAVFKGPSIEGTPLLKFSVYEKLPVGDNFKVGVSDVINFENLPDSTGKYEKMKDLLKNVRVQMDKLQNSDD